MLTGSSYAGLFLASLLAATLFPLGSEAMVAAMAAKGFAPLAILVTATLGNTLGAWVNYLIGLFGDRFILSRWVRFDPKRRDRAEGLIRRWGSPLLVLAWLPVIGDPLTLVAGVVRIPPVPFTLWVAIGKGARYALVIRGASWMAGGG
jgi:membrane protein YqaA with SNARE-associated domain